MVYSPFMNARRIAYFSMEIALDEALPTYSGGLGVLAGDTLRAAADLGLPLVAVTLLYRQGYFRQYLDAQGHQSESPVTWTPADLLTLLPEKAHLEVEGRPVCVRAWRYLVQGVKGYTLPVYFLDTDVDGNAPEDRRITDTLYGGDERYRLRQEAVLGLGGVAMLEALGLGSLDPHAGGQAEGIDVYHMNEGHAALLTLALLERQAKAEAVKVEHIEAVRRRCVFTTHTPVPAGHDTFPVGLAAEVIGNRLTDAALALGACPDGRLNMSELAIKLSRSVNGVAKRHGEISRRMFPGVAIGSITNGVHAYSWTADAMRALFDKHLPGWRADNNALKQACELPLAELREAHQGAKAELLAEVRARAGVQLDQAAFTIGFARRAAEYKRADLLFQDTRRLVQAAGQRPLQILFAGKAHPRDMGGKRLIERVHAAARELAGSRVTVVYLENYDMRLGRVLTSGVDLWLNNPVKPLEASGTSGMKAAVNGVPSLSTLDGWWVEGLVEGVTGWEIQDTADAFGGEADDGPARAAAAESLYTLLERVIVPGWYERPDWYGGIMRNSIQINGSYFNTHRMVLEYFTQAYMRRLV